MTELVVLAWNFKLLECYRNLEKLSWNFVFIWILLWQTWKFLFHHTTYWYSLTKIWLMIIFLGTNSLGKPLSLARWYTMEWNNFWMSILKFTCCFHKIFRTRSTLKSVGIQTIFRENTGPWKLEHTYFVQLWYDRTYDLSSWCTELLLSS